MLGTVRQAADGIESSPRAGSDCARDVTSEIIESLSHGTDRLVRLYPCRARSESVVTGVQGIKARIGVAMTAVALIAVPALAVQGGKSRPSAVAVSFDPITSFTPASADPRLAAAFAGRGAAAESFKF